MEEALTDVNKDETRGSTNIIGRNKSASARLTLDSKAGIHSFEPFTIFHWET